MSGIIFSAVLSKVVRLASQSLSGTEINITGLPSGVKKIEIAISGLSTNGTSIPLLRLGDSGGAENTGYSDSVSVVTNTSFTAATNSTGFPTTNLNAASSVYSGMMTLIHLGSNLWVWAWNGAYTNILASCQGAGNKTLSAELDRIQFTMVNGTDTFDGGTIQVSYYYE
jgi:hypothetical protein